MVNADALNWLASRVRVLEKRLLQLEQQEVNKVDGNNLGFTRAESNMRNLNSEPQQPREARCKSTDDVEFIKAESMNNPDSEPPVSPSHRLPRATDFLEHGATDFPEHGATDFLEHGATDFPEHGTTDFPEHGATDFPEHGATDSPEHGATGFPQNGATDFPQHGAADFPEHSAADFPEHGATDFPQHGATDFPSYRTEKASRERADAHRIHFLCNLGWNNVRAASTRHRAVHDGIFGPPDPEDYFEDEYD